MNTKKSLFLVLFVGFVFNTMSLYAQQELPAPRTEAEMKLYLEYLELSGRLLDVGVEFETTIYGLEGSDLSRAYRSIDPTFYAVMCAYAFRGMQIMIDYLKLCGEERVRNEVGLDVFKNRFMNIKAIANKAIDLVKTYLSGSERKRFSNSVEEYRGLLKDGKYTLIKYKHLLPTTSLDW